MRKPEERSGATWVELLELQQELLLHLESSRQLGGKEAKLLSRRLMPRFKKLRPVSAFPAQFGDKFVNQ